MNLYLVARGNERFYCPPEQVDYWISQGCSVYELTPTKIAGSEDYEDLENSTTANATVNETTVVPESGSAVAN